MIRIDLHVHTHHSRDCRMTPQEIIATVQQRGLGGVAITDHNAIAGALELAAVAPFPVIVGEEIKTTEGEIIGLFLTEQIARGLSPAETIAAIRAQGGLVYVPHPLDSVRRSPLKRAALDAIVDEIDVLEVFNARVLLPWDNRRAREFALAHGIPAGGGSDAHIPAEIGAAYVEMPPFSGRDDFMRQIVHGQVRGRLSPPWVHWFSTLNKHRK